MFDLKETTLYRMHNAEGELIYVGVTFDPHTRFGDHRQKKPWWADVATIHVQHFEDRDEARQAEQEMIRKLKPVYNIAHATLNKLEASAEPRGIAPAVEGECDRCGLEAMVTNELGGLCVRCETQLLETGELVI